MTSYLLAASPYTPLLIHKGGIIMKKVLTAIIISVILCFNAPMPAVLAFNDDTDIDIGQITDSSDNEDNPNTEYGADVDIDIGEMIDNNTEWDSEPQRIRTIDFEKPYLINSDYNNIVQQTSGGIDNSGCLRVLPRAEGEEGNAVTFLNYRSIVVDKNDPTFRTAVKPDTTYNVSVKVKFGEIPENITSKLIIYYDYYGEPRAQSNIFYNSVKSGEWITYNFNFKTGTAQDVIAFAFNAGTSHPEILFDDIIIKEMTPNYDGPQSNVIIDFENTEIYSFEQNDRMGIDQTTGPNGSKTNALHVYKGNYPDSVTFINWSGITKYTDPVFCVPVFSDCWYVISAYIKVEDDSNGYSQNAPLLLFYDFNDDSALRTIERIPYGDVKGDGWVKYETRIFTRSDQEYIRFTFNANYVHPEFWLDDITIKQLPYGYIQETENSYCEDFYNELSISGYKISNTVSKPVLYEIPVKPSTMYTFGVTLSGSGKITVSTDKTGKNILHSYTASKTPVRVGFEFLTDKDTDAVYVLIEPDVSLLKYEYMNIFETVAVSFGTAMGYTENPNLVQTPEYSAVLIDQTGDSPNMGNDTAWPFWLVTLVISLTTVICTFRLNKKEKLK